VVLRFTTSDATPPSLVKQSPAQGADGLPLKTVVRLEFSEPVDRKSVGKVQIRERTDTGRLMLMIVVAAVIIGAVGFLIMKYL